MTEQVRVFVSHHHSPDEDAFTARLVADLEAAGADVWVDTAGIPSGSFVAKISEGLAGRQWLVLVMTPAALASPWVRREVEAALSEHTAGRMLGVVPLMMQPCREQDIPILWRPLHRYDATRDYVSARDGLLRALMPATQQPQPIPPHRSPASLAPLIAPGLLPIRLAQLGFVAYRSGSTEYIVPPLCDVPAGEFLMGSDPKRDKESLDDEKPQHRIALPAYQIARYPVTVAEYACFVHGGHAEPKPEYSPLTWQKQRERLDHPVVGVSWYDAVDYASWLAMQAGQPWRLPSEAEWEKAARWDPTTRTSRIYPWGDNYDKRRANTSEGGPGRGKDGTTPVGSYASSASPSGAQDMAGNVWEWTSSIKKPYPYTPSDGREDLNAASGGRVQRGGSWLYVYLPNDARAASRFTGGSGDSLANVGFRLVLATPS